MRVFAAVLLSIGLTASPLLARNANETAKEETPAAAKSSSAVPDKPAPVKAESSAIESEMQELRSLVEEQRAELEAQRAALKAEQLKMEELENRLRVAPSEPPATVSATPLSSAAAPITASAGISATAIAASSPAAAPAEPAQKDNDEVSPLQFKIGSAYITPVGFLDFTGVYRSKTGGSGIGTNFASIPYAVTAAGIPNFPAHLSELRESMQNSRIGFRVDAMVAGAHVIGYMESDFLGNNPGNVAVSSNSNTLRSRLYWVDVQKAKVEVLGGQTWSLITPGRTGISPLPGNLFFTQNIDVNYQLGLVWGRIPELRFVLHPSNKVAFAVALDSPEQYGGGSAGGGTIVLPVPFAASTGACASGTTNGELNCGGTTLNVPNTAPDFIEKLAFDPVSRFHFELGGLERVFKIYSPLTNTYFTKAGAGGFVNLNGELFKGFRLITNNYWSDGGGRYIFGQAPDLIVRTDGSISPVKSASTVSGFEFTHGKSMLYGYYGWVYVWKNLSVPGSNVGYGVTGSAGLGQNRQIQEYTTGFNQTIWRDAKYGALNFMGQYSYVSRNPWSFTTGGEDAHLNMIFLNLRYTLPGSAPTLGK
jgi:hypothetical protein